jgi:hypothetical protein
MRFPTHGALLVLLLLAMGLIAAVANAQQIDERVRADRAVSQAMDGNFSDAMRTAGTISRPDIRDFAYHRIALVRFKPDRPGVAQTLARVSNAARRRAVQRDLAILALRAGDGNAARGYTADLDPVERDAVAAETAMVLAEAGDLDGAQLAANSTALGERRNFSETLLIAGYSRQAVSARARMRALEADTHNGRLDGLLAVARAQALDGKPSEALLTIGRLRMELDKNVTGKILRQEIMADTAIVMMLIGDLAGARQAANSAAGTVKVFLLRQIDAQLRY